MVTPPASPSRVASSTLIVALLVSAVAVVPATLRFEALSGRGALAFIAYWGALAFGVGAVGVVLHAAWPLSLSGKGVVLGIFLSVLPLAIVAQRVKALTHHRPLGAVAFSAVALVMIAVLALCVRRVLLLFPERARFLSWALAAAGALLGLVAIQPLMGASALSTLTDFSLVLASVIVTTRAKEAWFGGVPRAVAVAAWVLVAAGGIGAGSILGVSAWQNAPLLAGAFGGLAF